MLWEINVGDDIINQFASKKVRGIGSGFRLVLEEQVGEKMKELSRLIFLEIILAKNLVLSDAENKTLGPLKRGRLADLPLH